MSDEPTEELDLLMGEIEREVARCEESFKMARAASFVIEAHALWGGAYPAEERRKERTRKRRFEVDAYESLLKLRDLDQMAIEVWKQNKEVDHG